MSADGQPYREIIGAKSFTSYESAEIYITSQKSGNYRIVSSDPYASPVTLPALEHYKLIHSSGKSVMEPGIGLVSQVKIFQYSGEQPAEP